MSDNSFESSFKVVCDKLVELAKTQGVLATPIEVGDTAIIPISELKVGFGGGGGEGTGEGNFGDGQSGQGQGVAAGGAGGVKVTPVALIVIDGDNVILETMDDNGGVK